MRKCLGRDIYEIMSCLQDERCRKGRFVSLGIILEDMMPMITETLSRVAYTLQYANLKCTNNILIAMFEHLEM